MVSRGISNIYISISNCHINSKIIIKKIIEDQCLAVAAAHPRFCIPVDPRDCARRATKSIDSLSIFTTTNHHR